MLYFFSILWFTIFAQQFCVLQYVSNEAKSRLNRLMQNYDKLESITAIFVDAMNRSDAQSTGDLDPPAGRGIFGVLAKDMLWENGTRDQVSGVSVGIAGTS